MAFVLLSRLALAYALVGLSSCTPATAIPSPSRDETVMLQLHRVELSPINQHGHKSPALGNGHNGASLQPRSHSLNHPAAHIGMVPMLDTPLLSNYRMMACFFFVVGFSALISACLNGHIPFRARGSKDRKENVAEEGKSDSSTGELQKEKAPGSQNSSPGPPAYVLAAQKQGEEMSGAQEAVPPGTGMCCCSSGLARLMRRHPDDGLPKDFPDRLVTHATDSYDSPFPQLPESLPQCSRVPFFVAAPPTSCVRNGHPDFSGTWACVKAEGQLDELMADFGLGYFVRSAAAAYSYGAGRTTRICEHEGDHIKYQEEGLEGLNVIEYDVPTRDVIMCYHSRTVYWDEVQTHVLVVEGKDVEKAKPSTWSTSWQYLVDENTLHIKSTSAGGHTGTWIYKRQTT